MARSGNFGRFPRSQPSLTATIVGLAREAQNQRDRNIMDAWQNGGIYEGRMVTDDDVLAYWSKRTSQLSKTDPLYDTYKSQYDQLEYGIAESKQGLLYAQGKISDGQMAQFYLDWAKKVPQDSAFWRTLQSDAARFLQNAKARARAGSAASSSASYSAKQDSVYRSQVAPGELLTDLMTRIAQDNSLIGEGEDLTKFMLDGQNDPGKMESLLARINDAMKTDPKAWTGVIDAIKAVDPTWDGNLSSAYFASTLRAQVQGYQAMASVAAKAGKASDVKKWLKSAGDAADLGAQVAAWPVAASYSMARETFETIWKDPSATDVDKAAAAAAFAKSIDSLAKSPGLNDRQRNTLNNDAAALRGDPGAAGVPSFYENFNGKQNLTLGKESFSGDQSGENASFSSVIGEIALWQQQMQQNPNGYVYASYKTDSSGNRVFDPTGEGPVGVVPAQSVLTSPAKTAIVPVPTLSGGAIMQAVVERPVVVDDPANPNGSGTVIGTSITTVVGGLSTTIYGIQKPDGTTVWTPVPPFSDNVKMTVAKDGTVHLLPPPPDLTAQLALIPDDLKALMRPSFANGNPPDGTKWTTKDKDGNTVTVTWQNGQFYGSSDTSVKEPLTGKVTSSVSTPLTPLTPAPGADAVFDKSRLAAGPNPRIDFTTAMVAQLAATSTTGEAVVTAWSNPIFQRQLQQQEWVAAGGSLDGTKQPDLMKLQQIADINQGIVRDLASSSRANFGPNAAAPGWAKAYIAQQRADLVYPSASQDFLRKQSGDTPAEIRMGQPITVPRYPGTGNLPPGKVIDDMGASHPAITPVQFPGKAADDLYAPQPVAPITKDDWYAKPAPIPAVPVFPGKAADDVYTPPAVPDPFATSAMQQTFKRAGGYLS